jgi:asparagine synthase (glutamine-hydrolysing)
MRLICGLVRLDGTDADRAIVDAMIAVLTPSALEPRIAVRAEGRAALAVLDFSLHGPSSVPPIETADGWLAADLRLDRTRELAAALDLAGNTDEHTLAAAALARWNADLPDRLDGDFALAAWDPTRERFVCARDIMGVRPLCFTHVAGKFLAFASLPEALQVPGLVPRRVDRLGIARLAIEHYSNGRNTGYEGIDWLEAGHSLILTREGLRLHRAWRPAPASVGAWRGSAEQAALRLRELLSDAVRQRLAGTGDVAAHLSGGLDSSSLAVIAARLLRGQGRRLHAYSLLARHGAATGLLDERAYVEAVLAQEPDIAWSAVEGADMVPRDPRPPLSGAPAEAEDTICAAAREAGCDRLLSGAGGDETVTYAGEAMHAALFRHGRWAALHAELAARARREGWSLARTFVRRVAAPLAPQALKTLRRRLAGRPPLPAPDRLRFLAPDLRAQFRAAAALPTARHTADERIALLTDSYVVGRNVRWAAIGARRGIAFTFPMLDRRVIDFMLSLPLERLVGDGYTRQPHRAAMTGILPEAIRLRESKFVPLPDTPLALAAAKPALLQQADRLRACAIATELFDVDAIARAIAEAPDGGAALAAARTFNREPMPVAVRHAIDAVLVLRLGLQVAGLS